MGKRNSKLQSQLSVSHNRMLGLQKKNEQLMAAQQTQLQHQEQQRQLIAEVDALKLQLTRPYITMTEQASVSN